MVSVVVFVSACGSNPSHIQTHADIIHAPVHNRFFTHASPDVHLLASAKQKYSRRNDKSRTDSPLLSSIGNIALRTLSITSKKFLGASLAWAVFTFNRSPHDHSHTASQPSHHTLSPIATCIPSFPTPPRSRAPLARRNATANPSPPPVSPSIPPSRRQCLFEPDSNATDNGGNGAMARPKGWTMAVAVELDASPDGRRAARERLSPEEEALERAAEACTRARARK
jgi:hypothetical protein